MNVNERIIALRKEMKREDIDLYIVPTADYHMSEYVGAYFKCRSYLTGFTGSAGTALMTPTGIHMWTDGRYFLQAEKQLEDTPIILEKMGEPGTLSLEDFIKNRLLEDMTVGMDGRCISGRELKKYMKLADAAGARVRIDMDLVGRIWDDRPSMKFNPVWILEDEYSGEPALSKVMRIRDAMSKKRADYHLVTSLYDIAWILNLRGSDIPHVPVFFSYLLIGKNDITLYANEASFDEKCTAYLKALGVELKDYDLIYDDLEKLTDAKQTLGAKSLKKKDKKEKKEKTPKKRIMLDTGVVNAALIGHLPDDIKIIDEKNPSELMRAIKNNTEMENTRKAHLKDAVAMTRFICWLKCNVSKLPMTEISASDYLEQLRREQEGFLDLSFDTICGYADHGAIVHYSADETSNAALKPEGLVLIDSGGHYLEGTTDITRTMALGPISDEMKRNYTMVLKGAMKLASAKFPAGVCGENLDALCRMELWKYGLDYRHGTGHGVGHILNVHEGPNTFRYRLPENYTAAKLVPGMITTDEPGFYKDGEYGIRIENELLCVEDEKTEYGQFYRFENLTLVPIDLDAIDAGMLSPEEKAQLNAYHRRVREAVGPYMQGDEERRWLDWYTRDI